MVEKNSGEPLLALVLKCIGFYFLARVFYYNLSQFLSAWINMNELSMTWTEIAFSNIQLMVGLVLIPIVFIFGAEWIVSILPKFSVPDILKEGALEKSELLEVAIVIFALWGIFSGLVGISSSIFNQWVITPEKTKRALDFRNYHLISECFRMIIGMGFLMMHKKIADWIV